MSQTEEKETETIQRKGIKLALKYTTWWLMVKTPPFTKLDVYLRPINSQGPRGTLYLSGLLFWEVLLLDELTLTNEVQVEELRSQVPIMAVWISAQSIIYTLGILAYSKWYTHLVMYVWLLGKQDLLRFPSLLLILMTAKLQTVISVSTQLTTKIRKPTT